MAEARGRYFASDGAGGMTRRAASVGRGPNSEPLALISILARPHLR